MSSYLITGASRGIGLALCVALAARPASEVSIVFAAARTKTAALEQLVAKSSGRVEIVPLDVTSENSIKEATAHVEKSLAGKGLDVLVNNAGIMPITPGGVDAMDDIESVFKLNVSSVHEVTRAFLPLLRKGNLKKVINISSTLGSIASAAQGMMTSAPAYKVSKAALNMLTAQYAHTHNDEGFIFVTLSPGWVQTDLGGSNADIDVETSAKCVLEIVDEADENYNGKFYDIRLPEFVNAWGQKKYPGGESPW